MVEATFSRLLALSAESRLFTMPAMLLLITCSGWGAGGGGWDGQPGRGAARTDGPSARPELMGHQRTSLPQHQGLLAGYRCLGINL